MAKTKTGTKRTVVSRVRAGKEANKYTLTVHMKGKRDDQKRPGLEVLYIERGHTKASVKQAELRLKDALVTFAEAQAAS